MRPTPRPDTWLGTNLSTEATTGERNRFHKALTDRLAAFAAPGCLKARTGSAYETIPAEMFAGALAANGLGRELVKSLERGETVAYSGDRAERHAFSDYKTVVQAEALRYLYSAHLDGGQGGVLIALFLLLGTLPGVRQHGALIDYDNPTGTMKRLSDDDTAWFAAREGHAVSVRPADADEVARCDRAPSPGETLLVAVVDDPLGGNRERIAFAVPDEHARGTCKLAVMDARRTVLQLAIPADGGIDFVTVEEALPGGKDWLRRLIHAVDAKRGV